MAVGLRFGWWLGTKGGPIKPLGRAGRRIISKVEEAIQQLTDRWRRGNAESPPPSSFGLLLGDIDLGISNWHTAWELTAHH
jgi:hypothetical protein